MGYGCPVCETPQIDDEHLANHIAFTALLGDDAHEAWLDEHVPDWSGYGPTELAEEVVRHATEREFPQVFEESLPPTAADPPDSPPERTSPPADSDVAEVFDRARALTARRLAQDDPEAADGSPETETE